MVQQRTTYGIIGYPVKHSLSPAMHNAAFAELGVDAEYKLFEVKEDELGDFFTKLREKNSPIFGLNVTIPYKQTVLKYLDIISPFAKKLQSVNTIVISDDRKLTGYNTDGPGFLAHLAELQFDTRGKRVTILGAGGTTRAIVAVLCLVPERPESIRIYNRTPEKAKALIEDLSSRLDLSIVDSVNSIDDLNIELADLLINTTSLGMNPEDTCLVDESLLHSNLLVYDVVYTPSETPLLKMAKNKGALIANGLGMLYYQGVLAFQHWAETQLDDNVKNKMRESLIQAARQK